MFFYQKLIREHIYIIAFELFPQNTIDYNFKLSILVCRKLLELDNDELEGYSHISKGDIDILFAKILPLSHYLENLVSQYYQHKSFYYSYGSEKNERFMAIAKEFKDKAKEIKSDAVDVNFKNIEKQKKSVKLESKELSLRIKKINHNKLENEKVKRIGEFEISLNNVVLIGSMLTGLFLISGFIYVKIFFMYLDINVGQFFTLQDYLATSIDTISTLVISTLFTCFCYFAGMSFALEDKVKEDEFNIRPPRGILSNYTEHIMLLVSVLLFSFSYYFTGVLVSKPLYILIYVTYMFFFFRLPFWKYIKNVKQVMFTLLPLGFLLIGLFYNALENANSLNSDSYTSEYELNFIKKYEAYNKHLHIASNSKYVFLMSKPKGEITILPKESIYSITKQKKKSDEPNLFEAFYSLIKLAMK